MSVDAVRRPKESVRRGSEASDRQVHFAVKDGRHVTFRMDGPYPPLNGYVIGVDDYHWVVLDREGATHLVHKSCQWVTIGRPMLDSESEEIRAAATPFRERVLTDVFHQTPPSKN